MPSAYILARDKLEQARALMANDVWRDAQTERMLEATIARLVDLDRSLIEGSAHCTPDARQTSHKPIDMIAWSSRLRS